MQRWICSPAVETESWVYSTPSTSPFPRGPRRMHLAQPPSRHRARAAPSLSITGLTRPLCRSSCLLRPLFCPQQPRCQLRLLREGYREYSLRGTPPGCRTGPRWQGLPKIWGQEGNSEAVLCQGFILDPGGLQLRSGRTMADKD